MTVMRPPLSGRKVFLVVSLIDVLTCNSLLGLGMKGGIWLLNLPATITLGRLASTVGGDALAMAVTIPAGAALYGWAGVHLHRGAARSNRRPASARTPS